MHTKLIFIEDMSNDNVIDDNKIKGRFRNNIQNIIQFINENKFDNRNSGKNGYMTMKY